MGRGSVGPEMVGRRRELEMELVLGRGSTGEALDVELWRENHFVGREKKLERLDEGDAERVIEGSEGDERALLDGKFGCCCCCCSW